MKNVSEKLKFFRIIKFLLFAFSIPFSYQIFRMGYFASLLPNPAIAKSAFGIYLDQGIKYFSDFFLSYLLFIPLLLLIFHGINEMREVRGKRESHLLLVPASFFLFGLIHATYILIIGGDFMHARLLLPSFFSIFISFFPASLKNSNFKTTIISLLLTWCFICGLMLRVPYGGISPNGIANERNLYVLCAKHENPVSISHYKECSFYQTGIGFRKVARGLKEKAFFYHENIGMAGFLLYPEIHVFDRLGLADPIASRIILKRRGRPGHERDLPIEWVLARMGREEENTKVKCAMDAIECGALGNYLNAIEGKLDLKKFLKNIIVSFKCRNLRIPEDPCEAKAKFCGK